MSDDVAAEPFDVDAFLAEPLIARVATAGPTVRPVWFLWEDGAFWWVTGSYARLPDVLGRDPRVSLVVDICDLDSGRTWQVNASGIGELLLFDPERARRKFAKYLGPDERAWPDQFRNTFKDPDAAFVRVAPARLRAMDMSF
ncbi:MAG: pyridoxamine 5'-phosphate oxidase family protein [Actinomycetota bacterium]